MRVNIQVWLIVSIVHLLLVKRVAGGGFDPNGACFCGKRQIEFDYIVEHEEFLSQSMDRVKNILTSLLNRYNEVIQVAMQGQPRVPTISLRKGRVLAFEWNRKEATNFSYLHFKLMFNGMGNTIGSQFEITIKKNVSTGTVKYDTYFVHTGHKKPKVAYERQKDNQRNRVISRSHSHFQNTQLEVDLCRQFWGSIRTFLRNLDFPIEYYLYDFTQMAVKQPVGVMLIKKNIPLQNMTKADYDKAIAFMKNSSVFNFRKCTKFRMYSDHIVYYQKKTFSGSGEVEKIIRELDTAEDPLAVVAKLRSKIKRPTVNTKRKTKSKIKTKGTSHTTQKKATLLSKTKIVPPKKQPNTTVKNSIPNTNAIAKNRIQNTNSNIKNRIPNANTRPVKMSAQIGKGQKITEVNKRVPQAAINKPLINSATKPGKNVQTSHITHPNKKITSEKSIKVLQDEYISEEEESEEGSEEESEEEYDNLPLDFNRAVRTDKKIEYSDDPEEDLDHIELEGLKKNVPTVMPKNTQLAKTPTKIKEVVPEKIIKEIKLIEKEQIIDEIVDKIGDGVNKMVAELLQKSIENGEYKLQPHKDNTSVIIDQRRVAKFTDIKHLFKLTDISDQTVSDIEVFISNLKGQKNITLVFNGFSVGQENVCSTILKIIESEKPGYSELSSTKCPFISYATMELFIVLLQEKNITINPPLDITIYREKIKNLNLADLLTLKSTESTLRYVEIKGSEMIITNGNEDLVIKLEDSVEEITTKNIAEVLKKQRFKKLLDNKSPEKLNEEDLDDIITFNLLDNKGAIQIDFAKIVDYEENQQVCDDFTRNLEMLTNPEFITLAEDYISANCANKDKTNTNKCTDWANIHLSYYCVINYHFHLMGVVNKYLLANKGKTGVSTINVADHFNLITSNRAEIIGQIIRNKDMNSGIPYTNITGTIMMVGITFE